MFSNQVKTNDQNSTDNLLLNLEQTNYLRN